LPTPHARDAGLRRISSITGWVAAGALSAVAVISVGVARASTHASSATTSKGAGRTDVGVTDPGVTGVGSDDPWGSTGSAGLQPPLNPPTQGLGGGQAVSGGS